MMIWHIVVLHVNYIQTNVKVLTTTHSFALTVVLNLKLPIVNNFKLKPDERKKILPS